MRALRVRFANIYTRAPRYILLGSRNHTERSLRNPEETSAKGGSLSSNLSVTLTKGWVARKSICSLCLRGSSHFSGYVNDLRRNNLFLLLLCVYKLSKEISRAILKISFLRTFSLNNTCAVHTFITIIEDSCLRAIVILNVIA